MSHLDARTKIVCVLAVNLIISFGIRLSVELLVLGAVSLLFLINGKYQKCLVYVITFFLLLAGDKFLLPVITVRWLSTIACLVFIAFRKFFFCVMTADFFVSTTEINELIASLEKMKISEKLIIPLAVLVRFFPTVKEEWNHIRSAMRMRNLGKGLEQFEYTIVPLLFSTMKIGEELSAAALSRGLGMEGKRTNLCEVSLKFPDYAVMFCVIVLTAAAKLSGG
ncbi:MAG: energy-coupling factor transporter transmembrane protein EcfT [Ruminococcus sp.]|nr:energy-coupling factor transporter transmembrane protein EcfT [Ruminococcus sp.]